MKKIAAFTLIEILIALFIFAIIAAIASSGLFAVIKAHQRTEAKASELQQLQIAMVLMQRDIPQMINRPIINGEGSQEAAVVGNDHSIEFTHAGYLNPLMFSQRSSLQRTAYLLKNHQLLRLSWTVLDRAPTSQATSRVLLNNVTALKIIYLDANNQAHSTWPPPPPTTNTANALLPNPIPKVVEITITTSRWGIINRIFFIPGGMNS